MLESSVCAAGVYGDVIRVKILYNKKDNALLQYSEPTQAQLGMLSAFLRYSYTLSLTNACHASINDVCTVINCPVILFFSFDTFGQD